MPALAELEAAWLAARADAGFTAELDGLLRDYVGRPSPLYLARRLSEAAGHPVYLKREDLNHTGAHKINNALGQALLARRMGKTRIIAETGAGQHGVATATACALLGLECIVYMGTEDMRRQRPNVQRMELLGATVAPGRRRRAHAQGGGQRRHPRLGGQRRRHALRDRLVRRPGAVPGARARPAAGDRRRGARAGPASTPGGCRTASWPASAAARTRSARSCPFVGDADGRADRRRGRGRGDRDRPPRRAADRRRPRRRAARRLLGDHAGRGGPDPRGALDLRRPRLPRHRPRARLAARLRPRALRRHHRRRGARRVPPHGRARGDHPGARVRARARLGARPGRRRGRPGRRSTSSACPAAATRTSPRCSTSSASRERTGASGSRPRSPPRPAARR